MEFELVSDKFRNVRLLLSKFFSFCSKFINFYKILDCIEVNNVLEENEM